VLYWVICSGVSCVGVQNQRPPNLFSLKAIMPVCFLACLSCFSLNPRAAPRSMMTVVGTGPVAGMFARKVFTLVSCTHCETRSALLCCCSIASLACRGRSFSGLSMYRAKKLGPPCRSDGCGAPIAAARAADVGDWAGAPGHARTAERRLNRR
jgi:hypothetical protein